jgi:flagellar hook assembly protein FlgD
MSFALDLSSERDVRLVVYDLRGARVRTLLKGFQPAGTARITWDGRDESGRPVANGVYLVRADAGDYHATRKAILMR